MEIIAKATFTRTGNDCLIKTAITVVKVFDIYMTFVHTQYCGGWCDDKIREERWNWDTKEEALGSFKQIVEQYKDYVEEVYEDMA
jgi:hypothetical protein